MSIYIHCKHYNNHARVSILIIYDSGNNEIIIPFFGKRYRFMAI